MFIGEIFRNYQSIATASKRGLSKTIEINSKDNLPRTPFINMYTTTEK